MKRRDIILIIAVIFIATQVATLVAHMILNAEARRHGVPPPYPVSPEQQMMRYALCGPGEGL